MNQHLALKYIFNAVIPFNTVFYLKHNFKLEIDQKICTFKNLKEISQKSVATLMYILISYNVGLTNAYKHFLFFEKKIINEF